MKIKFHTKIGIVIFFAINAIGFSLVAYSLINFGKLSQTFIYFAFFYALSNLLPVYFSRVTGGSFILTTLVIILAAFHLTFPQAVVLSLLSGIDITSIAKKEWFKIVTNISIFAIVIACSKLTVNYLSGDIPIYKNIFANLPLIFGLMISAIILNYVLIVLLVIFVDGKDLSAVKLYFEDTLLFEMSLVPLGILTTIVYYYQPQALVLLIIPLLLFYVTFNIKGKLAKTREMAVRDKLTGLFNRHLFDEQIAIEIAQARRENTHLSILMLDLDNFKQFNDTFGHPEGDLALRKVADIVKSAARESDITCRYGGEEFILILPGTPTQGAAYVANRIRKFIELEAIGKPVMTLTASIGVASYPEQCKNKNELIEIADRNLYMAKNAGKNRIKYLVPKTAIQ